MKNSGQAKSLRPEQAAQLLGVTVRTVWRWLHERPDMPKPIKLSAGCTVFDRDELLAWRDSQPRV